MLYTFVFIKPLFKDIKMSHHIPQKLHSPTVSPAAFPHELRKFFKKNSTPKVKKY